MLPSLIGEYSMYLSSFNSVFRSQKSFRSRKGSIAPSLSRNLRSDTLRPWNIFRSNLNNYFLGKLYHSIFFSIRSPSFANHVRKIFFLRPQEKMIRIDTGRVIAFMAYKCGARFNRTIMKYPGLPMGTSGTSMRMRDLANTITTSIKGSIPYPASIFMFIDKGFEFLEGISAQPWSSLSFISHSFNISRRGSAY